MPKTKLIGLILILSVYSILWASTEYRTGALYCDARLCSELIEVKDLPENKTLLTSVDLSSEMPPVGNQGNQGSCVAWAVGYYHKTHTEYKEHNWNVSLLENQFSPAFIYNLINGGADLGAYFVDAVKVITDNGVANMVLSPYNQYNYTSWPSETAFVAAIPFRGQTGYYIDCSNNNGIALIKARLNAGYTVVLGIDVYANFDNINNFDTVYCSVDRYGENRGGHAITIVGYNDNRVNHDTTGAFKIVNSWGTFWGNQGYAWISYKAIKDPYLSHRQAYYITDRINYSPTFRVRTKITHSARTRIQIRCGFGPTSAPRYTKNFFDFYMTTNIDQPFPNNNLVFDLTDGYTYFNPDSIVFIRCLDTYYDNKTGTLDYFADDLSRISYDPPIMIPDYNVAVYAKIPSEPPMGIWVQRESMPTQVAGKYVKNGGALVAVDSGLYAFRGNNSKEFYYYRSGNWRYLKKESIPYGYKYPLTSPPQINKKNLGKGAALCYDGDSIIYATKGNGTWEFWAYKIKDSIWLPKAFVPAHKKLKGGTSLTFCNGKVYLLAGGQDKNDPENFFVYNPTTDSWRILTGAPRTDIITNQLKPWKDGSCIVAYDNKIYALKGGDKHNLFYEYRINGDSWIRKETIPLVHPNILMKTKVGDGGAMTTDGNEIFVIKGKGKQDFWKYTPSSGTWTPLSLIPSLHKKSVPKTGASLAYNDSGIYLLKGNNTPEFWQFVFTSRSKLIATQYRNIQTTSYPSFTTNDHIKINVMPNPAKTIATIYYTVPNQSYVTIKLYDIAGNLIKTIKADNLRPGNYTEKLITSALSQGIYFINFVDGLNQKTVKLTVY
ncbi:MAG: C1 family peptidase [candidate division WOR-3 bacterium]